MEGSNLPVCGSAKLGMHSISFKIIAGNYQVGMLGSCSPNIPHTNCAIVITTKHALFIPPVQNVIVLGQDQQCLLASLVMCILVDFRLIGCKGGWLLDPIYIRLVSINSH